MSISKPQSYIIQWHVYNWSCYNQISFIIKSNSKLINWFWYLVVTSSNIKYQHIEIKSDESTTSSKLASEWPKWWNWNDEIG